MTTACGYYRCIETWDMLDDQTMQAMILLYVGATLFMFLGLYLNEVLPHEFGVQKHPLFCLRMCKKRHRVLTDSKDIESEDCFDITYKGETINVDLTSEDSDVKAERERINGLLEPYEDYALLVKGIRKIYDGKGGQPHKLAVKRMNLLVE
jgi:hypothetical protein